MLIILPIYLSFSVFIFYGVQKDNHVLVNLRFVQDSILSRITSAASLTSLSVIYFLCFDKRTSLIVMHVSKLHTHGRSAKIYTSLLIKHYLLFQITH